MTIVIVIPTYNEAKNIGRMIQALAEEVKKMPQHTWKLLVVDDSSPDGTGELVTKKAQELPFVHLLVQKEKKGLGVAYTTGFNYAMRTLSADYVMEMDADFQHDPSDVTRLIAELDKGADYVIGSRFITGGSIPKEWAFYRKVLSVGGNIFTKLVLGVFSVNDFTSGFKASRVKGFVDTIDLVHILSGGFAYKVDLLYKMHLLGAKIKEVPIAFGLRKDGDSKMERNNMADTLRVVISLRINHEKRLLKFLVVGLTGLFVDEGLFNLLRLTPLGSHNATLISGLSAMATTYLLNNYWSFSDTKVLGVANRVKSIVLYFGFSYLPIILRSFLIVYTTSLFGDTFVVSNITQILGILLGLIWNFTVYSKIIWRNK